MNDNLFTIYDVARLVGVKYYQIAYAHDAGLLAEPPRFAGRRVYDVAMLKIVRDFFKERSEEEVRHECQRR